MKNTRKRIFCWLEEATLFTALRFFNSCQRSCRDNIDHHGDEQWIHHPDNERLGSGSVPMAGSGTRLSLLGRHHDYYRFH
jgi:hypothetical protein